LTHPKPDAAGPSSANRPAVPVMLAFLAGALLWFAASLLTARREPWDSSAYWAVVYPLSIVGCAALGYRYPDRPWRWALVLFEAQFVAMCVRTGEVGNLWPMGMALFAIVAIPGVVAARVASQFTSTEGEEAA
jgi:hypothetical protein